MIRSAALSVSTGQNGFISGKGKDTRVFTVQTNNEYRCVCFLRSGRPCGKLLGKGRVDDYETVCPKCGAILKLTKSGIRVIQTAKHR